mgnify:FL=1
MNLPFELRKNHKSHYKYNWRQIGLNMEKFESVYDLYIHKSHCGLCNNKFKTSIERCMYHCKSTGEFKNIVCRSCILCQKSKKKTITNTSSDHIHYDDKRNRYIFEFKRKGIRIQKKSVNKEIVIAFRDKWIEDHPEYFIS